MNIQIKNSSDEPIYLQVKKQIRDAIISGELAPDELLPSIRLLAKELRISVITTKRAYDELEQDGFIHTVQGKGSFVASRNNALMQETLLKKIESYLREALHYAKLAKISRTQLAAMLKVLEEDDGACD